MTTLSSLGSSLGSVRRGLDSTTGNITAAGVDGHKGSDSVFSAQVITQGGRSIVSGVSQQTRQRINVQGDVSASNVSTHVAISGDGFIPVASTSDTTAVLLTRSGDFAIDRSGDLVNSSGYAAMGWQLDDAGAAVGGATGETLKSINVRGLSGKANATTRVDFDMRLDSGASVIKGSGQIISFSSDDTFNASISDRDVIIPNGDNINLGDLLAIQVGSGDKYTYQFGGVASSFNVQGNPIFGKVNTTDVFANVAAGAAPAAGEAVAGDKLTVKIGNADAVKLKFAPSNPNASNFEFSSLSTLKDALNKVAGLTARISSNTLYVAAEDGTQAVTFGDDGASNFVSNLGLTNIVEQTFAAPTDARRFTTLGGLKKQLIADGQVNVAKPTIGSGIDVSAKDPLQQVTFTAKADRKNPISYVYGEETGVADAAHAKAATTLKIMAANNGLKTGDYVRLTGLDTNAIFGFVANGTANGLYYVTGADNASFSISASAIINNGGGGAFTAAVAAGATWQKTTGNMPTSYQGNPTVTIANGNNQMTITIPAFNGAGNPMNGLANNDIAYISGFGVIDAEAATVVVPDGYYQVTGVIANAGTFVITTLANAANPNANAGIPVGHNVSIKKVGASAAGNAHLMTSSTTFTDFAGAPAGTVRVYMPDHGYSRDDYFRIGGTAIPPLNGTETFQITNVDTNGLYFDFITTLPAKAALIAGGAANGFLPATNFIDRMGLLDKDLKLSQSKDGVAEAAAYIPGDADFGLVSGKLEGTWNQSVMLYDSQGNPHNFNIAFAKVANNKWAVEIYVGADSNGVYDVTGAPGGVVKSGFITFDGNGNVASFDGGIEAPITITWANATNDSSVTFNWGDSNLTGISALTNGGVRQTRGANSVSFIDQDGYQPGKFTGVTVDDATGNIVANFDNGETIPIYRFPICYVPAANMLEMRSGGIFATTQASGSVLYKSSGEEGVGTYVSSALEGSNIDSTNETVNLTNLSSQYKYVSNALFSVRKVEEDFLARM